LLRVQAHELGAGGRRAYHAHGGGRVPTVLIVLATEWFRTGLDI
jgi:hypothetical protein